MDLISALKKFLFLFLLMIFFPRAPAAAHSVQFLYTALTPGVNLTAVVLLDGEQIVYYDTNISKMIPKTAWMKTISTDDPDYWRTQTQRMQSDQEKLKQLLDTIMKDFNYTEGLHTLQRMYGCELDDGGTTRGYDRISYDGGDFISLDLKTGTWTATDDKAVITREKWESTGAEAELQKIFLEKDCIGWLKNFVSYSKETMKIKGYLSHGEQAGIIIGAVLLVIAVAVGLIICNKCTSGHEGYIARTEVLELV